MILWRSHRRERAGGFTIAELMVTIAIVATLAVVALPVYGSVTKKADIAVARSDVRNAITATETMLVQIKSLGAGATVSQTPATGTPTALSIANPNGLPTSVTVPVSMTAGSSLAPADGATNVIDGPRAYCLGIVFKGKTAYHGPNGPVTDCFSSTPTGGGSAVSGSYANAVLNPSFSATGGTSVVRTNLSIDPAAAGSAGNFGLSGGSPALATSSIASDNPHGGTTSLKRVITAAGGTGAAARSATPTSMFVKAGDRLSWSLWVFSTRAGSGTLYGDASKVVDGTYTGISAGAAVIPANVWTKVSGVGVAGVDMNVSQIGIYGLPVEIGDVVWFDDFLVEASPAAGTFFYGASAAAGDFTYAWAGAAHASVSYQLGVSLLAAADSSASSRGFRSTAWAKTGTQSLRQVPISSDTNTFTYVPATFTAGETYTILATARLAAPQTGTLHSRARSIYVQGATGAGLSSPAPNAAGTYQLALTFTAASSTGNVFLYNGASAGGGDMYWDDILVTDGTYGWSYFDGDSPGARWLGTPGNSASTLPYS